MPTTIDETKNVENETTEETTEETPTFQEQLRKMLLAGVGAVVLAREEVEAFLRKLVERGELAEKEARKMLQDIWARKDESEAEETPETDEEATPSSLERILTSMNLPSRKEIDTLGRKIDELAGRLGQALGRTPHEEAAAEEVVVSTTEEEETDEEAATTA